MTPVLFDANDETDETPRRSGAVRVRSWWRGKWLAAHTARCRDPLAWNSCGCITALRDTCASRTDASRPYEAAFPHVFAKP
jgi:hypothetical protein